MQKSSARVMLVDDERLILSSYQRALRRIDAEIVPVESPVEALARMAQRPADVVVSDYRMPTMNGDEFLEQVRQRWPGTTRVLITAYADVQIVEDVVRRGEIFRFLTKPCDTNKLRATVSDALAHHARIEQDRRTSRKRELDLHSYRHLFEGSCDAMMFADLDGNIVQANDAFAKRYGVNLEDALRKRPRLLTGMGTGLPEWTEIKQTLDRTGHWSCEITRARYSALLTLSQISDEEGSPYAISAFEKDISERFRLEEQNRAAQYEVILALAKLAEYRDPETGAHLERMQRYSRILARTLAENPRFSWINDAYVEAIFYSSPLHDIGKVGIPDSILLKPDKLTEKEWEKMKTHTLIGSTVLAAAGETLVEKSWLSLAHTIALQHHEKFDGSGYPNGLAGEAIDLSARIVALADVYDAISSKRVYKDAMPYDEARKRILDGSGSHFDPAVIEAFVKAEDDFRTVRMRFDDEDMDIGNRLARKGSPRDEIRVTHASGETAANNLEPPVASVVCAP